MSVTKSEKKTGVEPEARRLRRELFDDAMLDRLMRPRTSVASL